MPAIYGYLRRHRTPKDQRRRRLFRLCAPFAPALPLRLAVEYLDKAWSALQSLTRPIPDAREEAPAYSMFEGRVTMRGMGWDPWVRTILPEEIPAIRDDLCAFDEPRVRAWAVGWRSPFGADDGDEIRYVLDFLERAKEFVKALADDGRGMVYMIG